MGGGHDLISFDLPAEPQREALRSIPAVQDLDYVALSHANLNVDNAYYWRDEALMSCGITHLVHPGRS